MPNMAQTLPEMAGLLLPMLLRHHPLLESLRMQVMARLPSRLPPSASLALSLAVALLVSRLGLARLRRNLLPQPVPSSERSLTLRLLTTILCGLLTGGGASAHSSSSAPPIPASPTLRSTAFPPRLSPDQCYESSNPPCLEDGSLSLLSAAGFLSGAPNRMQSETDAPVLSQIVEPPQPPPPPSQQHEQRRRSLTLRIASWLLRFLGAVARRCVSSLPTLPILDLPTLFFRALSPSSSSNDPSHPQSIPPTPSLSSLMQPALSRPTPHSELSLTDAYRLQYFKSICLSIADRSMSDVVVSVGGDDDDDDDDDCESDDRAMGRGGHSASMYLGLDEHLDPSLTTSEIPRDFRCHRIVLAGASKPLRRLFEQERDESEGRRSDGSLARASQSPLSRPLPLQPRSSLTFPGFDPAALAAVVAYIYEGGTKLRPPTTVVAMEEVGGGGSSGRYGDQPIALLHLFGCVSRVATGKREEGIGGRGRGGKGVAGIRQVAPSGVFEPTSLSSSLALLRLALKLEIEPLVQDVCNCLCASVSESSKVSLAVGSSSNNASSAWKVQVVVGGVLSAQRLASAAAPGGSAVPYVVSHAVLPPTFLLAPLSDLVNEARCGRQGGASFRAVASLREGIVRHFVADVAGGIGGLAGGDRVTYHSWSVGDDDEDEDERRERAADWYDNLFEHVRVDREVAFEGVGEEYGGSERCFWNPTLTSSVDLCLRRYAFESLPFNVVVELLSSSHVACGEIVVLVACLRWLLAPNFPDRSMLSFELVTGSVRFGIIPSDVLVDVVAPLLAKMREFWGNECDRAFTDVVNEALRKRASAAARVGAGGVLGGAEVARDKKKNNASSPMRIVSEPREGNPEWGKGATVEKREASNMTSRAKTKRPNGVVSRLFAQLLRGREESFGYGVLNEKSNRTNWLWGGLDAEGPELLLGTFVKACAKAEEGHESTVEVITGDMRPMSDLLVEDYGAIVMKAAKKVDVEKRVEIEPPREGINAKKSGAADKERPRPFYSVGKNLLAAGAGIGVESVAKSSGYSATLAGTATAFVTPDKGRDQSGAGRDRSFDFFKEEFDPFSM